jgi:hypothetical protein
MAYSRVTITLKPMPAAAGHAWTGARMFAIPTTNLPRGS